MQQPQQHHDSSLIQPQHLLHEGEGSSKMLNKPSDDNYYGSKEKTTGRRTTTNYEELVAPVETNKRKEIYTYQAPFYLYSSAFSFRPENTYKFRLAVGSFNEEYNNKVQIVQLNEDTQKFYASATFDHPYPATKVLWIPDIKGSYRDILATTGDYLRIWSVQKDQSVSLDLLMNNNRSSEYCAPLTSADWNDVDPSLIGTSSIDTTCTIWQIETQQAVYKVGGQSQESHVKTQLIAHDMEVYDIAFSRLSSGRDIFGSVGADGSVRMFDLRHMEYSTIVYEEPTRKPILRIAWNKQDPNYLACFAVEGTDIVILDVRVPSLPVAKLENHKLPINGISWAPHSAGHICTAGDDRQALIWDVNQMPKPIEDPILAYAAEGEINQINWSATQTDWISICYDNNLQLLRV